VWCFSEDFYKLDYFADFFQNGLGNNFLFNKKFDKMQRLRDINFLRFVFDFTS